MKYLIIYFLVSVVLLILYHRLRPFLRAAQQTIGMIRDAQARTAKDGADKDNYASAKRGGHGKLIQCSCCGTWIIKARAISLNGMQACSQDCLKKMRSS